MKFFSMVDRFGVLVAVSLENVRAIECNDYESSSEIPYIRFIYTDNTSHCIPLRTREIAMQSFCKVISILNNPKA